jgi:mRNA-degrading endonuclease toxin of MazEF toxin-antitoxin module
MCTLWTLKPSAGSESNKVRLAILVSNNAANTVVE